MQISAAGIKLIQDFEGLSLRPYRDVADLPTIGYGHKILPDEKFGKSITIDAAIALLDNDLKHVESAINALAPGLPQNQFDVLCSFAFECGVGALQKLLSHGLDQVPEQLPRWVHAGGQVVRGMEERRAKEVALWKGETH